MNAIAKELDERLRSMDLQTAAHVEKLVRSLDLKRGITLDKLRDNGY